MGGIRLMGPAALLVAGWSMGGCFDPESSPSSHVRFEQGAPLWSPATTPGFDDGGAPVGTTGFVPGETTGGVTNPTGTTGADPGATGGTGGTPSTTGVTGDPGVTTGGSTGGGAVTGSTGGSSGGSSGAGAAQGTLFVEFTTVSLGGRYSPKNIGAVWVERQGGGYVRTLERWAGIRVQHLHAWNAASGGWGFFGTPEPDAISRATLRSHETHSVQWSSRDLDGAVLPDGTYELHVELTDASAAGKVAVVTFEKSASGFTSTPSDQQPFKQMSIRYEP